MSFNDTLKLSGKVKLVVVGSDGTIKDTREVKNLIVTSGLIYIGSRIKDNALAAMSHLAVGSGNTTPTAANTTLSAELSRIALSSVTVTNNSIEFNAGFSSGTAISNIREAGIFNYGTATATPSITQAMLCRSVFTAINKSVTDSLSVTWTLSLTPS